MLLKIRLKQIIALPLEEKNFPVCHFRRNEHLNGLSCSGVYRPLVLLVIMKECTSYKVHHVHVMMSIAGDADDNEMMVMLMMVEFALLLI